MVSLDAMTRLKCCTQNLRTCNSNDRYQRCWEQVLEREAWCPTSSHSIHQLDDACVQG